jgi:hypothetical protein
MKRLLALALVVALVLIGLPAPLAAAATPQANGQISGVAKGLANHTVRVRNVATGQLVATGNTNAEGAFTISGLTQGNYVVEIVDAAGKIVGTSSQISLTAAAMTVSGVSIGAAGAAAAAAAAGGAGAFFASTAGVVLIVAAGAGVAGIVYAAKHSPKK